MNGQDERDLQEGCMPNVFDRHFNFTDSNEFLRLKMNTE